MSDMAAAIIPKSDQLNADDLLAGPRTITITGVVVRAGQEQPVSISYEGDNGKPYKACKSMCRVMVAAWGPDSSKYAGRSMTLYCDPKVKWGGMEVGGIRISHLSHIDQPMTLALTATRGKKTPYIVKPLQIGKESATPKATAPQPPSSSSQEAQPSGAADRTVTLKAAAQRAKLNYGDILTRVGVSSAEEMSDEDYKDALAACEKRAARIQQ